MCGIERASTQPAEAVMTADGEMRDNETCAWPWMALSVLIDLSLCKQWQRIVCVAQVVMTADGEM